MPRDTVALLDAPPDLTTPSLAGLSWLLRHKESWPEGFRWDFGNCRSCAIGLAYRLIEGKKPAEIFEPDAAGVWLPRAFPVLADEDGDLVDGANKIFFGELAYDLRVGAHAVTPEHVADAIDAYLAGAAPCS